MMKTQLFGRALVSEEGISQIEHSTVTDTKVKIDGGKTDSTSLEFDQVFVGKNNQESVFEKVVFPHLRDALSENSEINSLQNKTSPAKDPENFFVQDGNTDDTEDNIFSGDVTFLICGTSEGSEYASTGDFQDGDNLNGHGILPRAIHYVSVFPEPKTVECSFFEISDDGVFDLLKVNANGDNCKVVVENANKNSSSSSFSEIKLKNLSVHNSDADFTSMQQSLVDGFERYAVSRELTGSCFQLIFTHPVSKKRTTVRFLKMPASCSLFGDLENVSSSASMDNQEPSSGPDAGMKNNTGSNAFGFMRPTAASSAGGAMNTRNKKAGSPNVRSPNGPSLRKKRASNANSNDSSVILGQGMNSSLNPNVRTHNSLENLTLCSEALFQKSKLAMSADAASKSGGGSGTAKNSNSNSTNLNTLTQKSALCQLLKPCFDGNSRLVVLYCFNVGGAKEKSELLGSFNLIKSLSQHAQQSRDLGHFTGKSRLNSLENGEILDGLQGAVQSPDPADEFEDTQQTASPKIKGFATSLIQKPIMLHEGVQSIKPMKIGLKPLGGVSIGGGAVGSSAQIVHKTNENEDDEDDDDDPTIDVFNQSNNLVNANNTNSSFPRTVSVPKIDMLKVNPASDKNSAENSNTPQKMMGSNSLNSKTPIQPQNKTPVNSNHENIDNKTAAAQKQSVLSHNPSVTKLNFTSPPMPFKSKLGVLGNNANQENAQQQQPGNVLRTSNSTKNLGFGAVKQFNLSSTTNLLNGNNGSLLGANNFAKNSQQQAADNNTNNQKPQSAEDSAQENETTENLAGIDEIPQHRFIHYKEVFQSKQELFQKMLHDQKLTEKTCEHLQHGLSLLIKRRNQVEQYEHNHGPGERETNLKMLLHQLTLGLETQRLHLYTLEQELDEIQQFISGNAKKNVNSLPNKSGLEIDSI